MVDKAVVVLAVIVRLRNATCRHDIPPGPLADCILFDIATALTHVHSPGIRHNDVKP